MCFQKNFSHWRHTIRQICVCRNHIYQCFCREKWSLFKSTVFSFCVSSLLPSCFLIVWLFPAQSGCLYFGWFIFVLSQVGKAQGLTKLPCPPCSLQYERATQPVRHANSMHAHTNQSAMRDSDTPQTRPGWVTLVTMATQHSLTLRYLCFQGDRLDVIKSWRSKWNESRWTRAVTTWDPFSGLKVWGELSEVAFCRLNVFSGF